MAPDMLKEQVHHPDISQFSPLDDKPKNKDSKGIQSGKPAETKGSGQTAELTSAQILNLELRIDDKPFKKYLAPALVPGDTIATMKNLFQLIHTEGGELGIEYQSHEGRKVKSPNEVLAPDKDGRLRADCGELSFLFIAAAHQMKLNISEINLVKLTFELEKQDDKTREDRHAAVITVGKEKYLIDFTFSQMVSLDSINLDSIAGKYNGKSVPDSSLTGKLEQRKIVRVTSIEPETVEHAVAGRLLELFEYYDKIKDAKSAFRCISNAYIMNPEDAIIKNNFALVFNDLASEQYDKANEESDKKSPDKVSCRKLYSNAVAYLKKALAISPENANLRDNLGNALYQQGKHTEALVEYKKAIAMNANDFIAYGGCFSSSLALGQFDTANAYLDSLFRLFPDHVETKSMAQNMLLNKSIMENTLGTFDYNSGKYDKAKIHFISAIDDAKKALEFHADEEMDSKLEYNLSRYEDHLEKTEKQLHSH
jgi:tetratricopeptide (TPR) repeat protein